MIHQPAYSLLNRWVEDGLLGVLADEGIGCIAFSPLAQGLLSNKYLNGTPSGSRGSLGGSFRREHLSSANLDNGRALNGIAQRRGQSLAQMAIAWVLRQPAVTSALIGASRWAQIEECIGALKQTTFNSDELAEIDRYALEGGLNLWARSSEGG